MDSILLCGGGSWSFVSIGAPQKWAIRLHARLMASRSLCCIRKKSGKTGQEMTACDLVRRYCDEIFDVLDPKGAYINESLWKIPEHRLTLSVSSSSQIQYRYRIHQSI